MHADDIVLGLFSFAKLLMYRDLDPAAWPAEIALDQRPLLRALLADGFRPLPEAAPDDPPLDELLPPRECLHVLDADASQAIAIAAARAGHNLLIQGPPGTGKSQTIANLIAAAVHDGKTVLFVAEKMAALEVVKRRLDQVGLGELCQELHSRQSNKRALSRGARAHAAARRAVRGGPSERLEALAAARARLNRHAQILHRPLGKAGVTPSKRSAGSPSCTARAICRRRSSCPARSHWRRAELRERRDQVAALARRVGALGMPCAALLARRRSRRVAAERAADDRPGGDGAARARGAAAQGRAKLQEWLGVRPVHADASSGSSA